MKWFKMAIIWGLILIGGTMSTSAKTLVYHQKSSGLSRVHSTRFLNNSKVKFVKSKPRHFYHVKKKTVSHQVKGVKGTKVNFKTRYLLPEPGKNNQRWGNPQAIAMNGKHYMYVVYCPTNLKSKGRIVRYDTKVLDQFDLKKHPEKLRKVFKKKNGKYTKEQKALQKGIKVGPLFLTGHGQSLAYNWKNHGLYMWQDNVMSSVHKKIVHINPKTLKPDRVIKFKMNSVAGGHNLTFDKSGNAYFWTHPGNYVTLFKGKIHRKSVKFRMTRQKFRKWPGTQIQSIAYNPQNKRLLLISDGSVASFPAKKLKGRGSLKNKDFKYTKFSPKREFQGIAYNGDGTGNLLVNHVPEVLKADRVY